MLKTETYSNEIPIRYTPDVMVCGGGPAGCAAAWSAARRGASVLLIESQGAFGGMGTVGCVPAFMSFGDGDNFLAGPFAYELLQRLEAARAIVPETIPEDTSYIIAFQAEVLKRTLDTMLLEAGVQLLLCTSLIDVKTNGRVAGTAVCSAKSGLFGVQAKCFIDCTGDGDFCFRAGAACEKGDNHGNLMPGTLCSIYANIDRRAIPDHAVQQAGLINAIEDGIFSVPDLHLPGFFYQGNNVAGGNISHAFGVDSTDEASLTKHLIDSRRRLVEYENFYKSYFEGFERMSLVATGNVLGIRESRRIICDKQLKIEHFTQRANFDDEIGRYSYPVDIHFHKPDAKLYAEYEKDYLQSYRYKRGESYGIPYGCLIPKTLDNVLVAGRCIGTDRPMNASIRVMPGCFLTGHAAGTAAAISAKLRLSNIREVPVEKIRSESQIQSLRAI